MRPFALALVLLAAACSDGGDVKNADLGTNDVDMSAASAMPDLNDYRPGTEGDYRVISQGGDAMTYQAFPDVARLANGDLLAVFYAGWQHISLPDADHPNGGRICMVRSTDDGRTWSVPVTLHDGPLDDRDPHLAQLADGSLLLSFFTYKRAALGATLACYTVSSHDGGHTWDEAPTLIANGFACSAPPRELGPDLVVQAVYAERPAGAAPDPSGLPAAYAAVARRGKGVWQAPEPVVSAPSSDSPLVDGTEADVIRLRDGRLLIVIRSDAQNMHAATSADDGVTWSSPVDIGFPGHCPQLTRLGKGASAGAPGGAIILTHRVPGTALSVSRDDGKSWEGPYPVDDVIGAYPTALELLDGSVLVIYYEEGTDSAVRIKRFRLTSNDVEWLSPP
jgi:hypothetical protein